MEIGIVNFCQGCIENKPNTTCTVCYLETMVQQLGFVPQTILGTSDIYHTIKESTIQNWIFSGSAYNVNHISSPQVPLGILTLPDKRYVFICYTMQSVLHGHGKKIICDKKNKQGVVTLRSGTSVFRNHFCYLRPRDITEHIWKMTDVFEGYVMTLYLGTHLCCQWHPERTLDGYEYISRWLHESTYI